MVDVKQLYELFIKYPLISTDSRVIQTNSIFFGLKGDNFDGNEYVMDALNEGAAYAVTNRKSFSDNNRCIIVDDTLDAIQQLALFHRKQFNIPIIGLSGTNGKTTTKELISTVLRKKYFVHATEGNLNNHIGVPLTLLAMKKDTEIAVVEMGANHKGEISHLCNIAKPQFGILTNIGKAHLEGFGSYEGVIAAKSELYQFINKTNGNVFVKYEDTLLRKLAGEISCIYYGSDLNADCVGEIVSISPFLQIKWQTAAGIKIINTKLINTFNLDNILAAICIGNYFGVDTDKITHAISDYIPQNNRSQIIKTHQNRVILDAYNANPTSMELCLRDFSQMKFNNKVVIIGDMLELGKASLEEHQYIVDLIREMPFKRVFLVGPIFKSIKSSFHCFENTMDIIKWISLNPLKNSTVFLKGSRKIELEKLVEVL